MIEGRSKLDIATLAASALKLNAGPYHPQSNKMYCRLCFAAKSIFSKASLVVCVITRMILPGFIQLRSLIVGGGFKFRTRSLCSTSSPAFSATMITRQGVENGDIRSAGVYMEVRIVFGFSLL